MLELFFLLLPVAAASGWYFGVKGQKQHKYLDSRQQTHHYVQGVNYLLNEQPDKAVDIFIRALEVDSDTVETHLALGNLFRRRGEVDRAIRIHQNLIARPQLTKYHKIRALLALGQDYLKAGFLDRSERLFLEVIESGEQVEFALQHLIDIYQQQKNWQQAIAIINHYKHFTKAPVQINLAHYYCELAQNSISKNNDEAKTYLKKALGYDASCVRANLLLAELEAKNSNFKTAIKAYQQIKKQDPEFFPEVVSAMVDCYYNLNRSEELIVYLWECYKELPSVVIMKILAADIAQKRGKESAIDFITQQLRLRPSLKGLEYLIKLNIGITEAYLKDKLLLLNDIVQKLLAVKPAYRCKHCGFSSKLHYWQCQGCKHWGSVKAIDTI